jgi:hypothetical protein
MIDFIVVGEAGLEPTTPGLEGRCSIQLSYSPMLFHCNYKGSLFPDSVDKMHSVSIFSANASWALAVSVVGPHAAT